MRILHSLKTQNLNMKRFWSHGRKIGNLVNLVRGIFVESLVSSSKSLLSPRIFICPMTIYISLVVWSIFHSVEMHAIFFSVSGVRNSHLVNIASLNFCECKIKKMGYIYMGLLNSIITFSAEMG